MADKAADGLPYGQFGRPVYDAEDKEWSFERMSGLHRLLYPVGRPRIIARPSPAADESTARGDRKDVPSRRREKQSKALVQRLPELLPASGFLPDFARVSEAVEDAASRYDSSTGRLFAAGKIYDQSRRSYVDAIAFATGPTGSDLRVVQGLKQRQGWSEDRSSWIETSDFAGEEATWNGPGVPILSICFAQPLESGEHYLAIRLPTETLVFRPVLKQHAAPGSSRLKPNVLFSIAIAETGGLPHKHVAFNPWFTGQMAIVDEAGNWTIWETGRKSSTAKMIRFRATANNDRGKDKHPLDDGWARVAWVESTSTLCVATRRKLLLAELDAADTLDPVSVNVGFIGGLGWILDVATLQPFLSHLFVLTSNHILVYLVDRASDRQISAKVILQLRHHRSPEDMSLRMSLGVCNDDVILLLHTSFDAVFTQFMFSLSDSGGVRLQSPATFALPKDAATSGIKDLHLITAPFINKSDEDDDDDNHITHFWHVYLLGKDSALSQTLYSLQTHDKQSDLDSPPVWTANVTKPSAKRSKPVFGGFVDDGVDDSALVCRAPTSTYIQRRQLGDRSRSSENWTVSYERAVQRLNEPSISASTDVDEVIEEISALFRNPDTKPGKPMSTLWEIADGAVEVNDVEAASARLEGLQLERAEERTIKAEEEAMATDSQEQYLRLDHIASAEGRDLLRLHDLNTLSSATHSVRHAFGEVGGVPLPDATAEAREKLVRQVAAEVTLASQVLRLEDSKPDDPEASQTQIQAWNLPVRSGFAEDASQNPKATGNYSRSRSQTPALPTPSASASTVSGSSHPLNSAAPEIARLSRYTPFSMEPPQALPRTLNKVLSHWTIGADPAEYDWQSTARQVSRRDEEAADDEEMTEKERRQMQRRTGRYIRRQRREAEESQRQQMLSSQAPAIVSASQPGLRRAESQVSAGAGAAAGSSQTYGPSGLSQMVASQVVPGRHGGRPPARKKRKSGF